MSAPRCYLSGDDTHDRVITAFAEGCKGDLVRDWAYEPSDVAVVFGVYKSKVPASYQRGSIISQQRNNNCDVVVLETGYINRGDGKDHHYAAGWNGLNGRADFRNHGMPGDRKELLKVRLRPWRSKGSHFLLCGQVPWDASVDHIDYRSWLTWVSDELVSTGRETRFRPHPMAKIRTPYGCTESHGSLADDLKDCYAVVAVNSNTTVEAVIAGVPAFIFDKGAMTVPVANMGLSRIHAPEMPEREQWLNNLAYSQWNLSEMSSGAAWRHLTRSTGR